MHSRLPTMSKRTTGLTLSILGVMALTPDSLLIRKVDSVPMWTILFYRNFTFGIFMLAGLLITEKWNAWKKIRALGMWGALTGLLFGFSIMVIFIAIMNTSAANVLVIQASNPVFATIFSYFILGEKVTRLTAGTSLVCVAAIVLIFAGDVAEGSDSEQGGNESIGLLCAVASSVTFGLYVVMLRWLSLGKGVEIDMMPCNIIAGFFAAFIAACTGPDLGALTGVDFIYILLQGFGVLGVGFMLLTVAPSYIPAPEVSLYTLIETVLGPVWVYIGGYEAPSVYAVCGGIILLIALAVHGFVSLKEETAETFTELKGDDNIGPDTPGVSMKQFTPVVGSVVHEEEDGVDGVVYNVINTGAAAPQVAIYGDEEADEEEEGVVYNVLGTGSGRESADFSV